MNTRRCNTCFCSTYLALISLSLILDRTMGSKSSPSAPVCSHSPDAVQLFQSTPRSTKSSLNVDRQVFVGRPRRLPLPRGVHDMAWLAGRPGGILIIWPAIRSRLSATMSCYLRCPVRLSTSIFVTWSFHVMPQIFCKFHWWKTSSCCHILAVLFQLCFCGTMRQTLINAINSFTTFSKYNTWQSFTIC